MGKELSDSDKCYLQRIGFLDKDIPIIEEAMKEMNYIDVTSGKKIAVQELSEELDRSDYLSMLGRATFHETAVQISTKSGHEIMFCRKRYA